MMENVISDYEGVTDALQGSTILVTGAAGFVGSALLCRMLCDPVMCKTIKQVIAIIRGITVEAAIAKLPPLLQAFAKVTDKIKTSTQEPKLLVLNGDCQKADFGLTDEMASIAQRVDIVIHAAGDVRFALSLPDAIGVITDLAYMTSRFSLTSSCVKTHIFLSTSFVAWFLKHGSTIREDFIQDDLAADTSENETHVNTYLYAKTLAEGCVNTMFSAQAGRPLHGKAVRILRLATLGPAAEFPIPGWGAGHASSPVSAAIAADPIDPVMLAAWMPDGAFLEIMPVDIAVNQIISLTAAVHRTHQLPRNTLAHPKNPKNPVNYHGANVPCYNIGTGLTSFYNTKMLTLNMKEIKLSKPFLHEEQFLNIYKPFISKTLNFDNSRTRQVLGISSPKTEVLSLDDTTLETPEESYLSSCATSLDIEAREERRGIFVPEKEVDHIDSSGLNSISPMLNKEELHIIWSDPPIHSGKLDIDCSLVIERIWGGLGGENAAGWIGYLKCVRDKMQHNGRGADWDTYLW